MGRTAAPSRNRPGSSPSTRHWQPKLELPMSIINAFHGLIPRRNKLTASYPDFAEVLSIWDGLFNCRIWLNRTKKGRPYLGLRLTKQGSSSKDTLKLALWEKETPGQFENRCDIDGMKLIFNAHFEEQARCLELYVKPALDPALLQEAIGRLPIPVLWQTLALPGTVKEHCCVRSPLRDDDRVPSFSIYAGGRRFKDHGSGQAGDSYDFFRLISKLDSKSAYRRFLELAQISPQQ